MAQNIYKVTKRVYDALKEGRIVRVGETEYSWDPTGLYTIIDYDIPTYTLKTEENNIVLYEGNVKKSIVTPNFAEFAATAKADDENNLFSTTYVKYSSPNDQQITMQHAVFCNWEGIEAGGISGGYMDAEDITVWINKSFHIVDSSGDQVYLKFSRDDDNDTNEIRLFGTDTRFTYTEASNLKLWVKTNNCFASIHSCSIK